MSSSQVLHVKRSKHILDMFVTDYSVHDKLSLLASSEPWAEGLAGMVLKVKLSDRQFELAQDLEGGSFCILQGLYMNTHTADGNLFQGRLGGNETCVIPLKGPQHMSVEVREMYDNLVEYVFSHVYSASVLTRL